MRAIYYLLVLLGLTVGIVRADQASEEAALQPTLTKYQKLFAMDGWKITLHVVPLSKVHSQCPKLQDAVACSEWTGNPATTDMTGELWIAERAEYTPELWEHYGVKPEDRRPAEVDQRNSVVHELLHVVWEYAQEEAAVAMIAGAINP